MKNAVEHAQRTLCHLWSLVSLRRQNAARIFEPVNEPI